MTKTPNYRTALSTLMPRVRAIDQYSGPKSPISNKTSRDIARGPPRGRSVRSDPRGGSQWSQANTPGGGAHGYSTPPGSPLRCQNQGIASLTPQPGKYQQGGEQNSEDDTDGKEQESSIDQRQLQEELNRARQQYYDKILSQRAKLAKKTGNQQGLVVVESTLVLRKTTKMNQSTV